MESSEDDPGTATSASRRASAREKDIDQAEDGNATSSTLQDPSDARSSCRTPAMSEENFDGDSVPSPSTQDVNTSTEAILDMIDEFVDGPGAPKRVPFVTSVDHSESYAEKIDDQIVAHESSVPVPKEDSPPPSFTSHATSAKCERKSHERETFEDSSQSNALAVVNTANVDQSQECLSQLQNESNVQRIVSDNQVLSVVEPQAVSECPPPCNIPSSSVIGTLQNTSEISDCDRLERTVKYVSSSDNRNDVTIESAESTSSDISLSEEKVVEQSTRSPLRRRLVRPGPSDRRPDSTVSSTVDIHTEQTSSDSLAKDVSSSSDAVPSIHGNVKLEESRNLSEISICKAETSTSPQKKIKLIRQKLPNPISSKDNLHDKSNQALEPDQCQSTSSDSSSQNISEPSANLSSISSSKPIIENKPISNDSDVKQSFCSAITSDVETIPSESNVVTVEKHPESSVEVIPNEISETKNSEEEFSHDLNVNVSKSDEVAIEIKEEQSSSGSKTDTDDNITESPKAVPKLTIKIGNIKTSEEPKSPIPKVTIKPIKPPEEDQADIEQIPNVTKLNIKPILKPEKFNDRSSEHSSANKLVSDQIPCVTKINIKPVLKPPEKINDMHRKSSSSEISESEYSENDESTSTSDQGSSEVVPKVTIKLGKPGTQSEGQFYTEQPNIPKLTIKGLQNTEKDETESNLKLVISQPEEKHSDKIPKLTIKTVTKCENQPLSPKLTIKLKPPENSSKEVNTESIDTPQVPKLKITTECFTTSADAHVPKITIKPVIKSDTDSKPNKKSGIVCDSPEHIPSITKLNIKPIVKPPESGETLGDLEDKVPVVSKLNIKPIIKPKDKELDSIEDVPKVTKLNIKPIRNPEDDSSKEKDCDEMNADIEKNSIPVVSKLNIKPIIKPLEEDVQKDNENQSSETGNSSDDNGDHIPVVTKLNIKPIVKPNEFSDSSKHKNINEESTPTVTKINIKPIIKPEESKSPASPKKELKNIDMKNATIPVVTKLNIKPVLNPNETEPNRSNDCEDRSVKYPPLVMKINMKTVAETSQDNIDVDKKLNHIDDHHEHLHNNIGDDALKIKPTQLKTVKPTISPLNTVTDKVIKHMLSENLNVSKMENLGSISSISDKSDQSNLFPNEMCKHNCVSEDTNASNIESLPTSSKEYSVKDHKTETSISKTNSSLKQHIKYCEPDYDIQKIEPPKENISCSLPKSITNEVICATSVNVEKLSKQVTSVKNCTLLKKLLESSETLSDISESQKVASACTPTQTISKESLDSEQFDSGHSSMEKVNDIGYREKIRSRSPSPEKVKLEQSVLKGRPIQELYKEAHESVTKPLEINVSEKLTNQNSGQDSPRIILKINKTDHGPSAKIITEDIIKNDSSQQSPVSELVGQNINDKPILNKKTVVNSRRKAGAGASPIINMGKRLRSSRIVDSAEKTPTVKRLVGKRPPNTDLTPVQNKDAELSVLETKRLKLGQLLSNKSLTITPVITKTSPDNKPLDNKQGSKILNHTLVNNENCSKNGNSKLHSILTNFQSKQIQGLPLNDVNCSDKSKTIPPEIESNASTGSSDVIENCHLAVQEMIINENSDFRDFSIAPDEMSQDPLEVEPTKTDIETVKESPNIPKFIESTPQPKKRGRPRKLPVSEGAKPNPLALPVSALEERPQRSLRLSRERPAILAKPRGRGRGRGGGRGGANSTGTREITTPVERLKSDEEMVTGDDELPPRTPDPLDMAKEEPLDPTSSRVKLPRMTEALDRLPGGSTPLSSRSDNEFKVLECPSSEESESRVRGRGLRGRGRGRTPGRSPRGRGRGRGGGRGAMYMKETLGIYGRVCGPATTTVQLFEEETCMMDDNATPAKPTHLLDEDSQSSVKSSTNESSKMKKSKFADLFDSNKEWTAADVKEYIWPPADKPDEESQVMMIQEHVAMFLGVKSFKRRYPELKRRSVAGDERDYVMSKGIVTEALCDLGVTAVDASEVLDIMLSDYPHKYEEYRSHQRARQLTEPSPAPTPAPPPPPSRSDGKTETKSEQRHDASKTDPEKTRQDLAAAAIASAMEWNTRLNALRRPACADLQTMALHTRRPPRAAPPTTHLRPPAGFYPHALLPGQYQHSYRRYTADALRYFPLNTVMAAPPPTPQPESSSDSDADSDRSNSSDDSDRLPAKRKRLSKVKRNSQTDAAKDKDREKEKEESREPEETCRVCKLRLEANRKYTHERFLVCATCNAKLHPGCTELGADTIRKCREYAWQCGECKQCGACGERDALLLTCGLCDKGFHAPCAGLRAQPAGRWHCVDCAVCKSCGARDPSGPSDPGAGVSVPSSGVNVSTPGASVSTPGASISTPGASVSTPGASGQADWHHQTKRGPGGHKVYSHSLCTPCARAYRIGRYCPLCERSFIGPKGTMQLVICKLCDRQLHQDCVRQTVSSLNVLDYTCAECRRGGITSRAAAVRLAPRTIATLFMAKRRFNKYAHRQYLQSRKRPRPDDTPDASRDGPDAPEDAQDAPEDAQDAPEDAQDAPEDVQDAPEDIQDAPEDVPDSTDAPDEGSDAD